MNPANRQWVFETVRRELARMLDEQGVNPIPSIRMDTSLTADLGLDSISFIEVAVALEKAFQVQELPLSAWSDRESEREGPRFTVGSLVEMCRQHLKALDEPSETRANESDGDAVSLSTTR